MSTEPTPVTEQHFGMVQYVVNLETPDTFTDGVLDAMAQIYWMFEDESGMEFSIDLRYHVQGKPRTKSYPLCTWDAGLDGIKAYLHHITRGIFERGEKHEIDDLHIELRIPHADFITSIPAMRFVYDTIVEAGGDWAEAGDIMRVNAPDKYKEIIAEVLEING
jgi:hypothetical protein